MLGQQIAPWPMTLRKASPPPAAASPSDATFKRMHRRMTPTPEPDPEPVFHPLRLRPILSVATNASALPPLSSDDHVLTDMRAPSSLTFRSCSSSVSVDDAEAQRAQGLSPVFTRDTHETGRPFLMKHGPSTLIDRWLDYAAMSSLMLPVITMYATHNTVPQRDASTMIASPFAHSSSAVYLMIGH
ncbi:hypothetical protein B0H16DRAFT_283205 [Mycena metata]|uniref:Uncharacterized protein n=1 Tax=Mycena metata TaxID=1033252 RepID=A0AAD7HQA1_9AGAR|nr:hypothetical protein B0H16DRAFT_283205 [Mycena metata]